MSPLPFRDPALLAALLGLIAGVLFSIRPRAWGVLLAWSAALGYGAYSYYQHFDFRFFFFSATVTALALVSFFAERISEKFGLRSRWLDPNSLWGAIIGSIIGLFLFNSLEMLLLGIFLGAAIAESRSGLRPALRKGATVFLSLLGGDGLRILVACAIAGQFLANYR
ncbi:MAG TPA: hypothetical protein DD435_04100 [Cyanobacteria bacterium UBA8530]|nr:hypothetical protein [Cyanobacteria bacterium UBA8530]